MILVHVTGEENVDSILTTGLRGPSCWAIDPKIVAAYTIRERFLRKRDPAWFMTSLSLFDGSVLQPDAVDL